MHYYSVNCYNNKKWKTKICTFGIPFQVERKKLKCQCLWWLNQQNQQKCVLCCLYFSLIVYIIFVGFVGLAIINIGISVSCVQLEKECKMHKFRFLIFCYYSRWHCNNAYIYMIFVTHKTDRLWNILWKYLDSSFNTNEMPAVQNRNIVYGTPCI